MPREPQIPSPVEVFCPHDHEDETLKDELIKHLANIEPPKLREPILSRPPVVGFVARRDAKGRDIVGTLKAELAPANNRLVAPWGPGGPGNC